MCSMYYVIPLHVLCTHSTTQWSPGWPTIGAGARRSYFSSCARRLSTLFTLSPAVCALSVLYRFSVSPSERRITLLSPHNQLTCSRHVSKTVLARCHCDAAARVPVQ